jgi:hypothetical protein
MWQLISRVIKRFGPTMLVTLSSQGISAVSLIALALLGPATSDLYSLGIQVGTSAFTGVVLQVLYLIALGRPWFTGWAKWAWLSAAFSVVLSSVIAVVTTFTVPHGSDSVPIILLFGAGGAFLALGGVHAVRLACAGLPTLMVGVTIIPNVGLGLACLVVRFLADGWSFATYLPATVWALLSVVVWIIVRRVAIPAVPDVDQARDSRRSQNVHTLALSVGLISNTVFPSLFVAALTQLTTGTTTIIFFISRIGNSLVGLFVNAVLAVRHNWSTEASSLSPIAQAFSVASTVLGAGAIALQLTLGQTFASYVIVVLSWVASIVAAPLVLRELNAGRMVRAISVKTVVDLIATVAAGSWFLLNTSVSGFFGVNIMLQAVALVTSGVALRKAYLTVGAVPLAIVSLAMIAVAW